MFRLLFVDDELPMLHALKRAVFRLKPDWQTIIAPHAAQARAIIQKGFQPDLILCDLLMPDVQGDALLCEFRQRCPDSIRALLTGNSSEQVVIKGYNCIHCYLAKPFTDQQLLHLLNSTEQFVQLPFQPHCRQQLGQLTALPMLPRIYQEIQQMISAEASLACFAKLIEKDPVLSAKIMQIANSAFLGFNRATTSLSEAITRLGLKLLSAITLATYCHGQMHLRLSAATHRVLVQQGYQHALLTRQLAKQLRYSREQQDTLYTAALLSSLGKMISCASGTPVNNIYQQSSLQDGYLDYSLITAYLLTLWGCSRQFCQIILDQNKWRDDIAALQTSNVLYVAHLAMDPTSRQRFLQHRPDTTLGGQPLQLLLEHLATKSGNIPVS